MQKRLAGKVVLIAIAPFIVYLASDESAYVTGGIYPIDSGYMAFKANLDVMGLMQQTTKQPDHR